MGCDAGVLRGDTSRRPCCDRLRTLRGAFSAVEPAACMGPTPQKRSLAQTLVFSLPVFTQVCAATSLEWVISQGLSGGQASQTLDPRLMTCRTAARISTVAGLS